MGTDQSSDGRDWMGLERGLNESLRGRSIGKHTCGRRERYEQATGQAGKLQGSHSKKVTATE